MVSIEPKMRSITGELPPNKLTEREDDSTCNVIYQANRNIKDLCTFAAVNSKFTSSELERVYNDLKAQVKIELFLLFEQHRSSNLKYFSQQINH